MYIHDWIYRRGEKYGKAVIFDLDGTLLNTLDDLEDSVNHTLNYFKYPKRTKAEVRSFIGGGAKALIKIFARKCNCRKIRRSIILFSGLL